MDKRLKNHHILTGRKGEALAKEWLELQGFTVLEANWRHGRAEFDLIACKSEVLHFVEVKTLRASNTEGIFPERKVNGAKMAQLKLGAAAYLLNNRQWVTIQFDIIAIRLGEVGAEIYLIEDVF